MDVTEPTKREPMPPLRRDDLAFIADALVTLAHQEEGMIATDTEKWVAYHKHRTARGKALAMLFRILARGGFDEGFRYYAGLTEGA